MFFTSISQMMTESVDLTLVIRKANGQLTVIEIKYILDYISMY